MLIPPFLPQDAKNPPNTHVLKERAIVWNLLAHLAQGGYMPVAAEAFDTIFSVDESRLIVRHAGDDRSMVIVLILGNGSDLISDHSDPTYDPNGFSALMDAFDAEAVWEEAERNLAPLYGPFTGTVVWSPTTWVAVNKPLHDFVGELQPGMLLEIQDGAETKRRLVGHWNSHSQVFGDCVVLRYRMLNLED